MVGVEVENASHFFQSENDKLNAQKVVTLLQSFNTSKANSIINDILAVGRALNSDDHFYYNMATHQLEKDFKSLPIGEKMAVYKLAIQS